MHLLHAGEVARQRVLARELKAAGKLVDFLVLVQALKHVRLKVLPRPEPVPPRSV